MIFKVLIDVWLVYTFEDCSTLIQVVAYTLIQLFYQSIKKYDKLLMHYTL